MSGTSLDGVDGALATFTHSENNALTLNTLATAYIPFNAALRDELMALQTPGENEIQREALAANALAQQYAQCVQQLLAQAELPAAAVCAIGAHGQTIRHRPELGYTRQINNPALLAELTNIDVIADFRSRDIAAGGQGAPLAPAFHQALFGHPSETRVIANIGGMSNISILQQKNISGFDTGPGNVWMDAWIAQQFGQAYDANGAWAATGTVIPALLEKLLSEPFFALAPPKSTGRDLFDAKNLMRQLADFSHHSPADIQATLTVLTAITLADAIAAYAKPAKAIYICGGGAYNTYLLDQLTQALRARGCLAQVAATDALGIAPNHVEALAFAWLAYRCSERQVGNLPQVTGAAGERVLGAIYPR